MPEPRDDPKKSWTYDLISPGANLQVERSKARLPGLVESVGTDGRFLGAVRTFPGFADTTVHNVPVSGTGRSVTWTLQNITLAKYASIAKGTSGARLRGIVLIADNQAGNKKAAYFAYYDSSTGTTDVKQITEDFTFSSDGNSEDISHSSRYIYVVSSTDSTANRAVWYNFSISGGWGDDSGQLESRRMGVSSDIEDGLGKTGRLLTRSGVAPADYTGRWDVGYYRIGVELVSRQHKLRSALQTSALDSSSNPLRITVSSETLQIQLNQIAMQIKVIGGSRYFDGQAIPVGGGGSATGEVEAGWGIQHWDQINIYRTVRTDGAVMPTDALEFLGALHLETFLKPSNFPSVVTTAFEKITYNLTGYSISLKDFWWRMLEPLRDLALSQVVTTYDPFIDAVGALPTPTSRVGVADGWVLLGSKSLGKNVLRYSTLTRD